MTSLPGRRRQACCTRPRPLTPPPCQNSATKGDAQKREAQRGKRIASSNLTETQNKSSVANKLVDMVMENMYCKIIAFALPHLYFAILYFCLQNFFSSCNTSFSFAILYFCLQKAKKKFSILSFSFAKLYSFAYICGIKLIP